MSSCYKVDLDLFPIRYFSVEGTSLEHAIRVILFNLLYLARSVLLKSMKITETDLTGSSNLR